MKKMILIFGLLMNVCNVQVLTAADAAPVTVVQEGPFLTNISLRKIDDAKITVKVAKIDFMIKKHQLYTAGLIAVPVTLVGIGAYKMVQGAYQCASQWYHGTAPKIHPQCTCAMAGKPIPKVEWGQWLYDGTLYVGGGLAVLVGQNVVDAYLKVFVRKVVHSTTITWYMRDQVHVRSCIARLKKDAVILEAEKQWHSNRGNLFVLSMQELTADVEKVCAFMRYKKASFPKLKRPQVEEIMAKLMAGTNNFVDQIQQAINTNTVTDLSATVKAYEQLVRECVKEFEDFDEEKEDVDRENDLQIQLNQARARIKVLEQTPFAFKQ